MRLAIISDTHDNLATLDKFLAYVKQNPVGAVIHCGDIAAGETLDRLAKNFTGPIFAVFGNMDYRDRVEAAAKKYPGRVELFSEFGQAELDGSKIGFCHHRETAVARGETERFDYIFYGHSHKPWKEALGSCQLVNPGNLAGMIYQATFAILDTATGRLELKIVTRL